MDDSEEAAMLKPYLGSRNCRKSSYETIDEHQIAANCRKISRNKAASKEATQLNNFGAVADSTLKPGETCYDMIWVEEWRGKKVRCRLVVRQYNLKKGLHVSSATPDSFFFRLQLLKASTSKKNNSSDCRRECCLHACRHR